MVPSYVIKLDNIPLNVNGTVDKKALPEIDINSLRAEYVAPETEIQKLIVEAFEEVFGQEKISLYDDFVRLGGDSLTAIKLLSYLDSPGITAADILTLHTPYAIAENIKEDTLDLDMYTLESGCPLNEPQLNVYLDIIANNMVNSYLIPLNMVISKEYDVDEIHNALNVMLDVHPILEMCVSDEFEVPYLVKGLKPSITFKSNVDDEFVNTFLTKGFDLNECLSKFLVVEKKDKYELFAVFHHIIFDAISENVFKRDLQIILDGGAVDVDDSFLKVSAFTQQIKDSEEYSIAHDFYNSMLTDVDEAGMFLDSVLPDGPGVSFTDLDLDYDLFKSFLDKYGVSENVLFISIFAYTLSRFTGNNKVLFNIIENGRDRFNNLDAIGMYVNTLPILVDCKNQSVSDFMNQMSDLVYDVMRHNYYSFRLLASEYELNTNILFQYLPDWIGSDEGYDIDEDNNLEDMSDLITEFNVNVIQKGDEYSLHIMYSDKYSCDMIKSFAGTYKQILSQMICLDELSDINYVSQSDLDLLDSINDKSCPLEYSDVLDAFNENLAKNPDNPLVSYKDVSYSYGEGAFIADKIAKFLMNIGVEAEDNVAFLVERSELYMFSVLGILSVGATYVPLDDAHPDDRIQFILEDTESKVVIVSDETYERAELLVKDVTLLNISDILKEGIGTLDKLPVVYGDVACMLYTSGTTGLPKGVRVTRKAVLNLSAVYVDKFDFDRNDVYGMFANISFDAGSQAVCQTFYAGACLSIVPDDIKLDVHELNNYFIEQGVTHTMITTQVGKLFMEAVGETSLDVLTVGGEKLGDFENPDDYILIDGFGPTETFAFISSINVVDKIDSSSIGEINYNTKFYVLDDEFRRVPISAVGELYISGYQVASGYLNREEENVKAFIDNPFESDEDYATLYRTGDMVRLLPDKTLAIVGRRDSQVKIRGNRVELSEIEAVIREIDYVDDVTIQTIKSGTNNELVAYVVISDDLEDSVLRDIIQGYVGERKPEYMVPSYVIGLDSIPLTVNGKVDKRALPEVSTDELRAQYVAPTNPIEQKIVEAFEKVFNQKKISIHDDFIRLGGNSLTAIRMISLLDFNIDVRTLLNSRTPHLIAQNIQKNNKKYGFELFKTGFENRNMFIFPPQGGLSSVFYNLVNNIDFKGNIYLIDDYKYDLSIDEIKSISNQKSTLNHYFDAISNIFQNGDILVGYSLGCIYATLIAEKLEKDRVVGKCILIDGILNFSEETEESRENIINYFFNNDEFKYILENSEDDFKNKFIEVYMANSKWDFHTPKVNCPILYLSTSNNLKEKLNEITDDYEFIIINSTHKDIIDRDISKIVKYFNNLS